MQKFPYDIVGFDLDGTLLDTHLDLGAALNHALALAGRASVPAGEVRALIGGGARKMLERGLMLTGGCLQEADFAPLHRELIAFYGDHIAVHTRLFPGGEAMLAELAERGVKLAVVTNKLEALARKVLEKLRLTDCFYTVIGGDTLGRGRAKPAPDLLHEMVARAGLSAPKAAYVGDTTFDTLAAEAAGLPCVAVGFGFNDLPPEELGADAVIGHFNELIPALEEMASITTRPA